jgi:cysteine desulfurase
MNIYFDNAATTPILPEVIALINLHFTETFGNPSSTHSFGRKAKAAIEKARKTIAHSLNASPLEIIFTSGGTESNNMAIKMAVEKYAVKHLIITEIEHKCVLNTALDLFNQSKIMLHILKVNEKGYFDWNEFEDLITTLEGKKMVSIMHANNEIGTINDIEKIAAICHHNDTLFHSDTVQTFAHYSIDVKSLAVDFLSGSAHKFHGMKGVGFLYVKQSSKLPAFIHGGGQERNMRSGTENVLGILAMEKALESALVEMQERRAYIENLKTYFIEKLFQYIENITINGDVENSLYHVLSVSFPEKFNQDMFLFHLDIKGIAVSGGSACSSGADTGSHVLNAIGHQNNRKTVRFSFSHFNTTAEIDYVIQVLNSFNTN